LSRGIEEKEENKENEGKRRKIRRTWRKETSKCNERRHL